VTGGGGDVATRIREAQEALLRRGAEVVFAELPLQQPSAMALCDELETDGFFFCGFKPRDPQTEDKLLLQKLMVPLDPALVQLASNFAHELLDYIAAERTRVSAGLR